MKRYVYMECKNGHYCVDLSNTCDGKCCKVCGSPIYPKRNATEQEIEQYKEIKYKEKKSSKILYLCDRRACEVCTPQCKMTKDITHAKNFENIDGLYYEVK